MLSEPLTDTSADELAGTLNKPLTHAEALSSFQSLGDGQAPGLIDVSGFGVFSRGAQRARLLNLIDWMKRNEGDSLAVREVIDQLSPQHLQNIGKSLDDLRPNELEDFVDHLAPSLTGEELFQVFTEASTHTRIALVRAAGKTGDEVLESTFADLAQMDLLETHARVGDDLNPRDRELLLDLGQLGLDITGIFDPTFASDGANTLISLLRWDLVGAGLSAISIIPYVGDLAKVGKLGKWAQTVESAIDRMNEAHLAPLIRPILENINSGIDAAKGTVWNVLPSSVRNKLDEIQTKIGTALTRASNSNIFTSSTHSSARGSARGNVELSKAPENRIKNHDYIVDNGRATYRTNASGDVTDVTARIDSHTISDRPRRLESQQASVGNYGLPDDEGGHFIANSLGGAGERINLFPQNWEFNRGQGSTWRAMEEEWLELAQQGKTIDVEMDVIYGDPSNIHRPTNISVNYKVDGVSQGVREFENGY